MILYVPANAKSKEFEVQAHQMQMQVEEMSLENIWKTVVNNSQGGSKRAFTRHNTDSGTEHQRLGPGGGGYSIWSRGASGGASGSSKESPRNNTSSNPMRGNRYSVFKQDDDLGGPELQPRHPMAGPRGEEDKLLRSMRCLLNKICPENYDKLKHLLRYLILKRNDHMKSLVNLIFEKAVFDQLYAGEYAKLCKYVVEKTDSNKSTSPQEIKGFRDSLLLKCQHEFEKRHKEEAQRQSEIQTSRDKIAKCKNVEEKARLEKEHEEKFVDNVALRREKLSKEIDECENKEKKKMLEDELESLDDASRRKSVGLIKFVAELYKQSLLSYKTILTLFKDLVKDIHRAEQAEVLCKLFITIGGLLWTQVGEHGKEVIKSCMNDVKEHAQVLKDSRIKFMLLDVLDLYDNNFVAKHRSQKQVGPTTKRQVLENMLVEQQIEKQTAAAVHTSGNRHSEGKYGGRYDYRGSNRSDSFNQESTQIWKTFVKNSQGGSKRAFIRHNTDSSTEHQRLEPGDGGYLSWRRGVYGVASLNDRWKYMGRPSFNQSGYIRKSMNRETMPAEQHGGALYQPSKGAAALPPREESPSTAAPSEEQLKMMVLATVGEYCGEVIWEIQNKIMVQNLKVFVNITLHMYFEKNATEIRIIGDLFNELFNEGALSDTDFLEGVKMLMSEVPDLAVDVPQLTQNFGTMIAPSVISGHLKLKDIWIAVQGADSFKIKLFCHTLQKMAVLGEDEAFRQWVASELKWEEIFKVEKKQRPYNIPDELKAKRLDFLPTSEEETISDYYHQWCKKQKVNIQDRKSMKDLVTKLILPTVKGSESSAEIEDFDALCDRLEGLKKFIEQEKCDRQQVELSVLYAMQAIAYKHGVPEGLLEYMFDAANNTCLVSLDSFRAWESSDNDEELGQGVCVTSLQNFFRSTFNKASTGLLEYMFNAANNTCLVSLDSFRAWESSDNDEELGQGVCVTSLQNFFRSTFIKASTDEDLDELIKSGSEEKKEEEEEDDEQRADEEQEVGLTLERLATLHRKALELQQLAEDWDTNKVRSLQFRNSIDSCMSTYKTMLTQAKKQRQQLPITMFITRTKMPVTPMPLADVPVPQKKVTASHAEDTVTAPSDEVILK
ncbi:Initiation factor eIF-4 gamma MA3 [Trinorchestia longiramus]|nr:Initiation factor eIF-4 gamma MA3 [Trinorchestia longiramus]